ncbi:MAG: hypothetical protein U0835_04230 [Isosphaeraceae bacterium]
MYLDGEEVLATELLDVTFQSFISRPSASSTASKVTLDNLRIATPRTTRSERQALEFILKMAPLVLASPDQLRMAAKEAVEPEARKIALDSWIAAWAT